MQAKTTAISDRDPFRCHIGVVVVKFQVLHKLIVCFAAVIFVYIPDCFSLISKLHHFCRSFMSFGQHRGLTN